MIKTAVCDGLFAGENKPDHVYKMALIGDSRGKFGASCKAYSEIGSFETSGPGYERGGKALTGAKFTSSESEYSITFDRAEWFGSFDASGFMIYNANTGAALMVGAFSRSFRCENGKFIVPIKNPITVKR